MTEIKNRLSLILYFEKDRKENKKIKEQIQELLLRDGKSAYLSKEVLDNTLKISIDEQDEIELIKTTITKINEELYKIISKIEDEISFYRKFSNFNPLRKIIGIVLLALQNIIMFLLVGLIVFYLVFFFIQSEMCGKILIVAISIILLYLSNWYLSKK